MIQLSPNEQVLLVMRRHWFVLVGPTALFVFLLVFPSLFFTFAPRYFPALAEPSVEPVTNFFLAVYLMGVLTYALVLWTIYYLDAWIITDQRIIDIEQLGLFSRTVSEIAMDRVQNVTVEIPGFIATMFKFGNIRIETAGESGFTISSVPDFYRAKDIILKHSHGSTTPQQTPSSASSTATITKV